MLVYFKGTNNVRNVTRQVKVRSWVKIETFRLIGYRGGTYDSYELKLCAKAFPGMKKAAYRHVPGSKPPFSLIPDPEQNKADTSILSVVGYGVYIPLSRPIQFCPLPDQNFEKNA